MNKNATFVLQKDKVVVGVWGHAIEFKKGEPTLVPKEMWEAVQAIGAIPTEELPEEVTEKSDVPSDPGERKQLIFGAFEKIVLKGERESFTGNGSPHNKIVSQLLGFTVEPKERDKCWAEFRQLNKED